MQCATCTAPAVLHLTEMQSPSVFHEHHLCEACCGHHLQGRPAGVPLPWPRLERRKHANDETRFLLTRLIISEIHEHQMVFLQEAGGERVFSFTCGIFEATSLDR